jgi:hypothetical protein
MDLSKEQIEKELQGAVVYFSSYYKYQFVFRGSYGGYDIMCTYGGHHDEIYRYHVKPVAIKFLPLTQWMYISIVKDGKTVFVEESW